MKNFTMLPNKVLKLFMAQELNSSDKAVLAIIVRQTIGYNRDSWQISKREFASQTGFSRRSINYSLEKLERMQYIALVNKGNSRLNFSEWKLSDKLMQSTAQVEARKTPRPMQPVAQDTPRPMQSLSRSYAMVRRATVPVNTLNTVSLSAAIEKLALLLKDKFAYKNGKAYRITNNGWVLINNPIAYLKSIENSPAPFSTSVEKQAKDMSDRELRDYFAVKKIGIDEDIPQDYVYEALERKIL